MITYRFVKFERLDDVISKPSKYIPQQYGRTAKQAAEISYWIIGRDGKILDTAKSRSVASNRAKNLAAKGEKIKYLNGVGT